ncbi:MAG: alcohol dehydrogenase catalytic domain-containing protein [Leifsonia sp.]
MLAAHYLGDRTIRVVQAEATPLRPGEARIDVAYAGICGTDLHIFHGAMDARVRVPATIGHEMAGTISAIADDVIGWAVGEKVTVMPLDWDGTCPACLAGHHHICQNLNFIGIDSPGALQQQWNVPSGVLVKVPDGVRLDHAALVEPVAVAVHDVRRSELSHGDRAVVIGAGPIGVLIASVAAAAGAEVVVIELDPSRRATAEALGLRTLDPRASDQIEWVDAWTAGAGADVVFEVSGSAAGVLGATGLAKVRGTVVVVAIHSQPRPLDLHRIFWRELRILGARVYEREDFEKAVSLIAEGAIPADALITAIVPMSDVGAAFETLERSEAMKILVDVAGSSL